MITRRTKDFTVYVSVLFSVYYLQVYYKISVIIHCLSNNSLVLFLCFSSPSYARTLLCASYSSCLPLTSLYNSNIAAGVTP